MTVELKCACGQIVRRNDAGQGGEIPALRPPLRCPACNRLVEFVAPEVALPAGFANEAPAPKLGATRPHGSLARSLWQLMSRSPSTESAPSETANEALPANLIVQEEPSPKGLWSVMGASLAAERAADHPIVDDGNAETNVAEPLIADSIVPAPLIAGTFPREESPSAAADSADTVETSRPKGLWHVMRAAPVLNETFESERNGVQVSGSDSLSDERAEPPQKPESLTPELDEPPVDESQLDEPDLDDVNAIVVDESPRVVATATSRRSANARLSLALGLLSLPLAAFSSLPAFWAKFPPAACGLAALVLGTLAVSEIRRSRGRLTGLALAVAGILIGISGMFVAPTLLANVGQVVRRTASRQHSTKNLTEIGTALDAYHARHGSFPAGAVVAKDADGRDIPLHGWMTALLPFLGEEPLYRTIDFQRAYDDPANLPAMKRELPVFLASGFEQRRTARGLAVAHFAGVGGEFLAQDAALARAGIFAHNTTVKRAEITDGLSQTIIAGEIASEFSAWGEPGNWRAIGEGLNADANGFGNADGTGALFLMADGSVRFFSSNTPRNVLERLSTRDRGDALDPGSE